MSDTPEQKRRRAKERPGPYRWAVQVFFLAIALSAALSLVSETSLNGAGAAAAALVLAVFIGLGILFDIIGVAVTAADPRPFHSMAAHKEPGAKEALMLLRNAGRVSSVCNDVVGDICGVISGSAAAVIAAKAITGMSPVLGSVVQLLLSAVVAGLTVGGKAFGKSIAMNNSTAILHAAAKVMYLVKSLPGRLIRRKRDRG